MPTSSHSSHWFRLGLGCTAALVMASLLLAGLRFLHGSSTDSDSPSQAALPPFTTRLDSASGTRAQADSLPPPVSVRGGPSVDRADADTSSLSSWPFVGPIEPRPWVEIEDTLGTDDSIYLSLKRQGLSASGIVELIAAMSPVFDSRAHARPGDHYALTVDQDGTLQRFRYIPRRTPEHSILVQRTDRELVARPVESRLRRQICTVEVRIQDNLSSAIIAGGERAALTDLLADDILGAVVDFRRDPRRGDRIGLVFEKLLSNDRYVRYGNILLARYAGQIVDQTAVRFTDTHGRVGYYDEDGKSLARQFLLFALPYRGITSHFSYRRRHPILKRIMPHLGTDYAARIGTRVWATGRGLVVYCGWKGALGKAIIIKHPNGYVTRYGHLSRILVRKGQRVQQKQVIGRVGATGRVTGPHLHYEIMKDGRHLNPETVNRQIQGKALSAALQIAFRARRDSLMQMLLRRFPDLDPAGVAVRGVPGAGPVAE